MEIDNTYAPCYHLLKIRIIPYPCHGIEMPKHLVILSGAYIFVEGTV